MLHSSRAVARAAAVSTLTMALAVTACGTPAADTAPASPSPRETLASTPSPAENPGQSPEAVLPPADYPTGAGDWIVYQAVFDGVVDIGLVRPDGSDSHRVPPGEWERWHPDWSPDGTRILYGRWVPTTEAESVAVVNLDGSEDDIVLACEAPCFTGAHWAPDGALAFYRIENPPAGGCLMGMHDLATGDEVIITEHPDCAFWDSPFAFSPDGQRLVFQREGADGIALFTIGIDGSDEDQLTDWGFGARPDWSPDGEWIVFMRDEHTPDTSFISLHRVRPDGTGLEQLTEPTAASDVYPRWLPDGSGILFSRCVGMWTCATRVIAPDGSDDRWLFDELGTQTVHVVWQPGPPAD